MKKAGAGKLLWILLLVLPAVFSSPSRTVSSENLKYLSSLNRENDVIAASEGSRPQASYSAPNTTSTNPITTTETTTRTTMETTPTTKISIEATTTTTNTTIVTPTVVTTVVTTTTTVTTVVTSIPSTTASTTSTTVSPTTIHSISEFTDMNQWSEAQTTTTTAKIPSSQMKRTIIFLHFRDDTFSLFFRGGPRANTSIKCIPGKVGDSCSIEIAVSSVANHPDGALYDAWRRGDIHLDWWGPELGQGRYEGQQAAGSPTLWTTNQRGDPRYHPFNTYGSDYWLMDFFMDCSQTDNGWFQVKGLYRNNEKEIWEPDAKDSSCQRNSELHQASSGHQGKCGFLNVFQWGGNDCQITAIPSE